MKQPYLRLLFALSGIGLVWLMVLPQLAKFAPVEEHIQRMQSAKIEVDAMFYSELNWQPPTGAAWRSPSP